MPGDVAQDLRLHGQAQRQRRLVDVIGVAGEPADAHHVPGMALEEHLQVGGAGVAAGHGGEDARLPVTAPRAGRLARRASLRRSRWSRRRRPTAASTGTVIASAFIAAAVASASSVSRLAGSAFAAAFAALSAALPATRAASSASTIAGAVRSTRAFSAPRIGAVIAANTADLPGTRRQHDHREQVRRFAPRAAYGDLGAATGSGRQCGEGDTAGGVDRGLGELRDGEHHVGNPRGQQLGGERRQVPAACRAGSAPATRRRWRCRAWRGRRPPRRRRPRRRWPARRAARRAQRRAGDWNGRRRCPRSGPAFAAVGRGLHQRVQVRRAAHLGQLSRSRRGARQRRSGRSAGRPRACPRAPPTALHGTAGRSPPARGRRPGRQHVRGEQHGTDDGLLCGQVMRWCSGHSDDSHADVRVLCGQSVSQAARSGRALVRVVRASSVRRSRTRVKSWTRA